MTRWVFLGFVLAALVLTACGGGDGEEDKLSPEAQKTWDTALETAEAADVSGPTREYAGQLCDPFKSLLEDFSTYAELFEGLEDEELSDDFEAGIEKAQEAMEAIKDPISRFAEDLKDVDPPDELKEYHEAFLAQMEYTAKLAGLFADAGFLAALAVGDAPPEPDEPDDLDDAILLECGAEIVGLLESEAFNAFLEDPSGGEGLDATPDASRPMQTVGLDEPVSLSAGDLGELYGEEPLSGSIEIRFTSVEILDEITSQFDKAQMARGKFVVVHYELDSDLDGRMQPSMQINIDVHLTDQEGRRWEAADYEGDYFAISGDAAATKGCDDPATWVGAGFSGCTAVVFDVPEDAESFSLVWNEAGLTVDLGQ